MKRDLDLVREILSKVERSTEPISKFTIETYDQLEVNEHVYLLKQAGFLEAITTQDSNGHIATAIPIRLTWTGHEFAQLAKNDSLWQKAKSVVRQKSATFTFEMLYLVLRQEAKDFLM